MATNNQYEFRDGDSLWDIARKILKNLVQAVSYLLTISGQGAPSSSAIFSGDNINVAVAGTAVQGGSRAATRGVLVTAKLSNTGTVYVGGSTVTNGSGARQGLILVPGGMSSTVLQVDNVNRIYVNADTAGDGVGILVL